MKTFIHGSDHEILIFRKYAHKSLFRAMLMFTAQIKAGVQEANALSNGIPALYYESALNASILKCLM